MIKTHQNSQTYGIITYFLSYQMNLNYLSNYTSFLNSSPIFCRLDILLKRKWLGEDANLGGNVIKSSSYTYLNVSTYAGDCYTFWAISKCPISKTEISKLKISKRILDFQVSFFPNGVAKWYNTRWGPFGPIFSPGGYDKQERSGVVFFK